MRHARLRVLLSFLLVCALTVTVVGGFASAKGTQPYHQAQASHQSYALIGRHWTGAPHSGCCLFLNYLKNANYPTNQVGIADGASAWNGSAANYSLTYAGGSNNWAGDTYAEASWVGSTTLVPLIAGANITAFTVTLNDYFTQEFAYNAGVAPYYDSNAIKSVAAHEFGHVAGLNHVSGCYLMNGSINVAWFQCHLAGPTQDEINGVNAQY